MVTTLVSQLQKNASLCSHNQEKSFSSTLFQPYRYTIDIIQISE